jgi:hypothetical protein
MKLSLALLAALYLALPTLAQDTKPVEPPKDVVHVSDPALVEGKTRLDAIIAAHGGEAFLNLKGFSLKGKGEASFPGGDQSFSFDSLTLSCGLPDRVRLDVSLFFGEISYFLPGGGKKPVFVMAGEAQEPPFTLPISDPTQLLRDAKTKNLPARPAPDLKVGDKTFLGILLPGASIYYDPVRPLARRIMLKNAKKESLTLELDKYKTLGGVSLPGTFVVRQGKDPLLTMTFDKLEIDPKFAEGFFAPPK